MNLYLIIRSPYAPYFDPLAPFMTAADKDVLAKFRKGYKLVNWNYTCPVNWYLESRNKRDTILVSGKDYDRKLMGHSSGLTSALLDIGTSAGTSDGFIASSWAHRDGGKPGREWFVFDKKKFEEAQARYKLFTTIRQQWDDNPIPLNFQPEQLSELALALLRYLRSKRCHSLWQYDELHPTLNELRLQGLLMLTDTGNVMVTDAARRLKVPKGPNLKLLMSPGYSQLRRARRHGTVLPEAA